MARKYVAFDIETAKEVPGDDFNWEAYRPLGISCAAAFPCDAREPTVWHGEDADGTPARQMSPEEVGRVVHRLVDWSAHGYTVLTWNGLGFDFDVLAEESRALPECQELAMDHVDMMFHVFCDRGFPVALDKAAQALRIPGKQEGMSGLLAPRRWAEGRHQEVIDYVVQDVRTTLQIAELCERTRTFKWKTRKGTTSSMRLARGWLTVRDAMKLPEPDTSWMTQPISRSRFTGWMAQR